MLQLMSGEGPCGAASPGGAVVLRARGPAERHAVLAAGRTAARGGELPALFHAFPACIEPATLHARRRGARVQHLWPAAPAERPGGAQVGWRGAGGVRTAGAPAGRQPGAGARLASPPVAAAGLPAVCVWHTPRPSSSPPPNLPAPPRFTCASRACDSCGVPGLAGELSEPLLFCELMVFGRWGCGRGVHVLRGLDGAGWPLGCAVDASALLRAHGVRQVGLWEGRVRAGWVAWRMRRRRKQPGSVLVLPLARQCAVRLCCPASLSCCRSAALQAHCRRAVCSPNPSPPPLPAAAWKSCWTLLCAPGRGTQP